MSVKEVDIFLISKRYFIFYENLNKVAEFGKPIAIMVIESMQWRNTLRFAVKLIRSE